LREGSHKHVKCASCHPNGQYKLGPKRCVDCHQKDDPHRGRLGKDCGKCHIPAKGAPKFQHERMTHFQRTDAHRRTPCSLCHSSRPRKASAAVLARLRQSPPPLDRTFPIVGRRCADCHADPHKGEAGTRCEACHNTVSWAQVVGTGARGVKPRDHRGAWLRSHADLPMNDRDPGVEKRSCARCHATPVCTNCHRNSRPKSHTGLWRVKTHGLEAGFDPARCRTCHVTGSCMQCHRNTPPLTHRGAWRTLHGFAAATLDNQSCFVCHRRADCAVCHRR
jgi:hypothetical protein